MSCVDLLQKVLTLIENGVNVQDLRVNLMKYLGTSVNSKEIVISKNGRGVKVSEMVVVEMAKRGCNESKKIIDDDLFEYEYCCEKRKIVEERRSILRYYAFCGGKKALNLLENLKDEICCEKLKMDKFVLFGDRENVVLINLVKEGLVPNLEVKEVYQEKWSYQVEYDGVRENVVGLEVKPFLVVPRQIRHPLEDLMYYMKHMIS